MFTREPPDSGEVTRITSFIPLIASSALDVKKDMVRGIMSGKFRPSFLVYLVLDKLERACELALMALRAAQLESRAAYLVFVE